MHKFDLSPATGLREDLYTVYAQADLHVQVNVGSYTCTYYIIVHVQYMLFMVCSSTLRRRRTATI